MFVPNFTIDFRFVGFRCLRNVDRFWAASQNARLENTEEALRVGTSSRARTKRVTSECGRWKGGETAHQSAAKEEDF